jgi:hypothetical protein
MKDTKRATPAPPHLGEHEARLGDRGDASGRNIEQNCAVGPGDPMEGSRGTRDRDCENSGHGTDAAPTQGPKRASVAECVRRAPRMVLEWTSKMAGQSPATSWSLCRQRYERPSKYGFLRWDDAVWFSAHGVASVEDGRSGLLHATTGAGKTYAVWLGALLAFGEEHPTHRSRRSILRSARQSRCACSG